VRTHLGNRAILEYDDLVGQPHGAETVRDDDGDAPLRPLRSVSTTSNSALASSARWARRTPAPSRPGSRAAPAPAAATGRRRAADPRRTSARACCYNLQAVARRSQRHPLASSPPRPSTSSASDSARPKRHVLAHRHLILPEVLEDDAHLLLDAPRLKRLASRPLSKIRPDVGS
jgi:hypothetical protein